MESTLKIAALLAVAPFIESVAVAQSTSEAIIHKTGTVVAKYDGKVAVQMQDGSIQEFTPAPGKTVMVDGVATTCETLEVGTVLGADFVKTETTTPVKVTTVRNGKVLEVVGSTVMARLADGTCKKLTVSESFKFLVDGKEVAVQDLREGMSFTARLPSAAGTAQAPRRSSPGVRRAGAANHSSRGTTFGASGSAS